MASTPPTTLHPHLDSLVLCACGGDGCPECDGWGEIVPRPRRSPCVRVLGPGDDPWLIADTDLPLVDVPPF